MSLESVRAFFAENAPDISVIESTKSSATVALAAEAYGVEPARIAKTLSLRVGDRVVLIVTSGTSRMDNKKVKALFGGKPKMLGLDGRRDHRPRGRRRLSVRAEDAAAGLLRHVAESIRCRRAGRGLDPQRSQDHAGAAGGTDVGRMGRRLRASKGGNPCLFVVIVRPGLHRCGLYRRCGARAGRGLLLWRTRRFLRCTRLRAGVRFEHSAAVV